MRKKDRFSIWMGQKVLAVRESVGGTLTEETKDTWGPILELKRMKNADGPLTYDRDDPATFVKCCRALAILRDDSFYTDIADEAEAIDWDTWEPA